MKDAGTLDPARTRLLALIKASGQDMQSLSRHLGRNGTYLQQYINKGSPRQLAYEDRVELARILGCTPEDLAMKKSSTIGTVAPQNNSVLDFAHRVHATFTGPRDLPILGYVKAGELGFFVGNGERQGVTMRPEPLRDVNDAYAVRVHDESMAPALEPGYLIYVDPTRPVKPGDTVVIQLKDGQAFIKRLVRRTEKALICKQFNPAGDIKYDPAKSKAVHLVVQLSMVDV